MERTVATGEAARGSRGRVVGQGMTYGLIAGLVFGAVELIGSAAMDNPALMPVRLSASVLLGREAFSEAVWRGWFVAVGLGVHFALSALFGLLYGVIESRLGVEGRTSWGRQSVVGLLFGAAVWLVDVQIIARLFYPWFLEAPQLLRLALHAVTFGLPLGLMFAATERYQRRTRRPVGTAVRA